MKYLRIISQHLHTHAGIDKWLDQHPTTKWARSSCGWVIGALVSIKLKAREHLSTSWDCRWLFCLVLSSTCCHRKKRISSHIARLSGKTENSSLAESAEPFQSTNKSLQKRLFVSNLSIERLPSLVSYTREPWWCKRVSRRRWSSDLSHVSKQIHFRVFSVWNGQMLMHRL